MRNEAIFGECRGQIVQKFMQESSNAKRCLGVEGVGRGYVELRRRASCVQMNCIDFPANISVEHLTATLKYETYNSR